MVAHKVPALRKSRIPRGSTLQSGALVALGPPMVAPPAPKGLLKAGRDDWATFWASPIAAHVLPAHLPALRRLFDLRDQRERYAAVGLVDSMSTGSTGQLVLSPLVKHLPVLDAAILALEDRFGLSPKHSIALSEGFDDASTAAARANEALASGFESPDQPAEPRPIRRIAAIE